MGGFPASQRRRGRLPEQLGPTTLARDAAGRVARPGAPTGHPPGPGRGGVGGLRGGCSKFHSIAHSRHRTYPAAERDASSLRLQGLGELGWGVVPATQQQPRLRAVAGVPGPCARRAARRPTLHKGSMALPRLLGSLRAAAAALPGAGPEGLAPFRPPALPLSSRPRPAPGLAGRAERRALGTQLRRGGDRRLLCDVSSLRGYLYPHDWISFMKPGPVCLCARVRVAKVPEFLRRPWGVGAGSEAYAGG